MCEEMCRVTTIVYPTSMAIYHTTDNGVKLKIITANDVCGCDDYEKFRATILEIIEERVGFELEEHERAQVDLDIQIWSNYFPELKEGRSKMRTVKIIVDEKTRRMQTAEDMLCATKRLATTSKQK